MKQIAKLRSLALLFAALMVMAVITTSCSDDEPEVIPDDLRVEGTIASSVPAVPSFPAVESPNFVVFKWLSADRKGADLTIGRFEINIPQMHREIVMEQMTITGITLTLNDNGSLTFGPVQFRTMSGTYETTGTIEGSISASGDVTATLTYKPGSMPMDVVSVFTSK